MSSQDETSAGALTREQKRTLATAVITHVADLFEMDWEHHGYPELADMDREAAKQQVAKWVAKLPGDGWDARLGDFPG